MSYRKPVFNVDANIFTAPDTVTDPPRLTVDCQLRQPGKLSSGQDEDHTWAFLWELLVEPGTDIRDAFCASGEDLVECPAGSGRTYRVCIVDDVARGFTNEYRVAMLRKEGTWPTPIP